MEMDIRGIFAVSTAYEYLGQTFNDEELEDWMDKNEDEYTAINEIIGVEISIYILRRTTGADGSIIDGMWELKSKLINEYEETYNKVFIDYNNVVC